MSEFLLGISRKVLTTISSKCILEPKKHDIVKIKGFEYARVLVKPGSDRNIEARFGTD